MAASPGFQALRERILDAAELEEHDRVLDIGAGTGLLTLAMSSRVAAVVALDVSPEMCARLEAKIDLLGIANTEVLAGNARTLPVDDESVGVVVSNYCFHHLPDADKQLALAEIRRVLRPGGRLVFADMMFRLGLSDPRDRAVIALLLRRIIRRGPAGLLRLAKNAVRILTGGWEHPASVDWWQQALVRAGFLDVEVSALEHEGGVACARKPGAAEQPVGANACQPAHES
jgi:ubiquinone/menaquinone biosynthesis C-methylase UbiE